MKEQNISSLNIFLNEAQWLSGYKGHWDCEVCKNKFE